MYIYGETIYKVVNTSITSYSYIFPFCMCVCVCVCVVRTSKTYSLSNFQVYYTAPLTIITVLYITSTELICLRTGSLCTLTNISPFPPPPVFGNHPSTLCFYPT